MEMVHKAWENVGAQTAAKCFKTCGFIMEEQGVGGVVPVQGKNAESASLLLST